MGKASAVDFANVSKERARLLNVQAQLRELELSEKRGDLIPLELVAQTWERLVGDCRAKLVNLPSRLAPQVVGCNSIAEVKELLERAIFECLDELASGASIPKSRKDISGSSKDSSVRMGRQKQKVVSRGKRGAGGVGNGSGRVSAGDTGRF